MKETVLPLPADLSSADRLATLRRALADSVPRQPRRRVLLPEAAVDERILQAARLTHDAGVVEPVLVAPRQALVDFAQAQNISLAGLTIIHPEDSPYDFEVVEEFARRMSERGREIEDPRQPLKDPTTFAAILLELGHADGMVSGATNTTSAVLRAALRFVGTAPGTQTVTSYFIMVREVDPVPPGWPQDGLVVLADCAVVIEPNPAQLADIAITVADDARAMLGLVPRLAMLSFATHGSASHSSVERVREATAILRQRRPDLLVDGELQADAALVPEIAARKCPNSPLEGQANILIFPDLDSGNIGYKLVQRLGKAAAIGPILTGLAKPINDLSRGCSVQDVLDIILVTAARAGATNGVNG
jgi:phosphate acetyltransferase